MSVWWWVSWQVSELSFLVCNVGPRGFVKTHRRRHVTEQKVLTFSRVWVRNQSVTPTPVVSVSQISAKASGLNRPGSQYGSGIIHFASVLEEAS